MNSWQRMTAITGMTGIVAMIGLTTLFGGCGKEEVEEPPPVVRPIKTIVVSGGAGYHFTFPATVEAGRRTLLSFRVRGRVQELAAREGDMVADGQLIAQLDPTDYQHAVDAAKAEYERAEADYRRYQRLYEKDAVPLADLDLYRSQRDVARAYLDDARTNLGYTVLKAPFSGQIGNRYVEKHQDVQAQQSIVDMHNTTEVELKIDVPEHIAKSFGRYKDAEIYAKFESLPDQQFPLELKEISTRADPETQTFRATLVMPQLEEISLLPGMTSEVLLVVPPTAEGTDQSVILIPAIAVLADERGEFYVWLIDETSRTASRRDVQVGELRGRDQIEILGGLVNGERVAISGVTQLREGMQVRDWDPFGKGSQ